ncbi:uncharacterized protein LOC144354102 [Saccoglossus kowalevskii]
MQHNQSINLPKLSLPYFGGDLLTWVSFKDSFYSAVHENSNLQNVQKFQYLRAQLTDEAAHTIEGLTLTNTNYTQAMDLLDHRYGQPHKIISPFMRSLWDLPEPSEDYHSLHNFYDKLESHICGLKSLRKKEDSYGDLLVPIVMDKLPGQIRKQIACDHGNNEWTLPDLRKAIQKEIEAIHAGDATDVQSNSNPPEDLYFL